jgi:hypothetical protein
LWNDEAGEEQSLISIGQSTSPFESHLFAPLQVFVSKCISMHDTYQAQINSTIWAEIHGRMRNDELTQSKLLNFNRFYRRDI